MIKLTNTSTVIHIMSLAQPRKQVLNVTKKVHHSCYQLWNHRWWLNSYNRQYPWAPQRDRKWKETHSRSRSTVIFSKRRKISTFWSDLCVIAMMEKTHRFYCNRCMFSFVVSTDLWSFLYCSCHDRRIFNKISSQMIKFLHLLPSSYSLLFEVSLQGLQHW